MRFIAIFGLLGLGMYAGVARAGVLWRGDFESGDLKQWDSSTLIKTGDRDNLVLETDNVAEGKRAAQITLRPDIIFEPYNQSRVEVSHNGLHTKNNEDSYFAWSFLVPGEAEIRSNIGYWESTPSYRNTMTFYIEPASGGGTLLKFGTGNLGETLRWTTQLELGKWHRLALHNHWSQSQTDGKVDVWYDGQQVVTAAVATKYNADELFFQMGLHRSDPAPRVQVIYIDAALEADSAQDILEPLPGQLPGSGGTSGAAGASGASGAGNVGGTNAGGGTTNTTSGTGGNTSAGGGGNTGASGGSANVGSAGSMGSAGDTAGVTAVALGGATLAGGSNQGGTSHGSTLMSSPQNDAGCTLAPLRVSRHSLAGWLSLLAAAALALRKRRPMRAPSAPPS